MGLDIYFFRVQKALVEKNNNNLEKVLEQYLNSKRKKNDNWGESFYARKEWWIPTYFWEDMESDDPEPLVLVSKEDLKYMELQYQTALNEKNTELILGCNVEEFDDNTKKFIKSQLRDIKKLYFTLEDDECILGYFSW